MSDEKAFVSFTQNRRVADVIKLIVLSDSRVDEDVDQLYMTIYNTDYPLQNKGRRLK